MFILHAYKPPILKTKPFLTESSEVELKAHKIIKIRRKKTHTQ